MAKVALVTGCSSGIGMETALELARAGYSVYAGVRSEAADLEAAAKDGGLDVRPVTIDVDDDASVEAGVAGVLERAGRIDVLVNNAGYILFGCVEDVSVADVKSQFETNFFGIVRMVQRVAPAMRAQGSGRIVNISSVVGRIGFPGSPAYVSTKFALEGLSECMRYELGAFGVQTVIIEPGVIKSRFMDNMRVASGREGSPYAEITDKVIAGIKTLVEFGTPASEVAKAVVRAAQDENPQPRYVVGNDARMFLEARASKTDAEFENYIKKELY